VLTDYTLNFTTATRPLLLIPIGLGYGALYYVLFRFAIRRFDLRTPGRELPVDCAEAPPDRPAEGAARDQERQPGPERASQRE
jgi:PTS system N-acetylglucosamine-specific IIC component